MKQPNKKYSFIPTLVAIFCLLYCSPHSMIYSNDPTRQLADSDLVALCMPFKSIRVEYVDNATVRSDNHYTDSFLIEAANGLLLYETTQHFAISPCPAEQRNLIDTSKGPAFSVLAHDTASLPEASQWIRELAARCSVDVVVLPYSCSITQRIRQPKGWRNNDGPGYERPLAFSAKTSVHIQLWNKNGQLLYERIGRSATGKPILYSLLKKQKFDGDIVRFAKKLYAPPLIKSLYTGIKLSMQIKT